MSAAWYSLVMLSVSAVTPSVEPGTVLTFRGQITAAKGDIEESRKSLELTLLVAESAADHAVVYWTLDEQGRGGWTWADRFGRLELDRHWRAGDAAGPALLYDRGDGKSVISLVPPLAAGPTGPLAKDVAWEQAKLEHRVVAAEKRAERDTWKVEARNVYGVRRTFWVDQTTPVVVASRERVFIGQGHEHELRVDLFAVRSLSAGELTAAAAGFDSLIKLRERLGRAPRSTDVEWNDQQLTVLRSEQSQVSKLAKVPILATVAKAIEQDTLAQKNRSGAVASLREKVIGSAAPAMKLDGIGGSGFDSGSFSGKVTVLHFWEYRDTPLEEPYGQTGYLDFLHRKRQKEGVQVYGVAVHEPGEDPGARRRSIQGANKLRAFMNLSYPLLVDDGTALKKLGDPRVAGGKLPLFVVVGPNGKVVEYHAGTYEVQRDRGLEELDAVVTKAVGKRE